MTRPGRLEGKTCLIVGGTGGIGLATAGRFAGEGARVVACGMPVEGGFLSPDLVERLRSLGACACLPCDCREVAEVRALFATTLDLLGGRLDVLFHVAGISGRRFGDGPLHDCTGRGLGRGDGRQRHRRPS